MEAPSSQQVEEPELPRNLRAELFQNLENIFTALLNTDATLPVAAKNALFEWVGSEAPIAEDVIVAISKNDPAKKELENE